MSIIHNGEDTLQSASIARSQGLLERFLEVPQAWPVGNTTAAVQPDKKKIAHRMCTKPSCQEMRVSGVRPLYHYVAIKLQGFRRLV